MTDTNAPAHARLSASGSSRWLNCPASVRLSKGLARPEGSAAREGTLAHLHSEYFLQMRAWRNDIDPVMQEFCKAYTDYVLDIIKDDPYAQLLIEQRVEYSSVVSDGFGTADAIIVTGNTLHICDLKYGEHVHVDADNNTQLMLYAIGFLNNHGWMYDITNVVLHICQPRRYNFDKFQLTLDELETFGAWAKSRAEMVDDPNTPPNPGEKQCAYCPVKDQGCKALTEHMGRLLFMDVDEPLETSAPACQTPVELISNEQMKLILYNEKLILAWLSAIRKLVYSKLVEGDDVDGFKLVEGRRSRAWRDTTSVERVLMDELDDPSQAFKPMELISPAQACKLLGKKKSKVLDELIVITNGNPSLALTIDRRQSVDDSVVDDFDMID